MIRSEVSRGRVDLTLRLDTIEEGKVQFDVDFALADQYYKVLQQLKERFGMPGEITLELLAGAKDLILAKETVEDVEPYLAGDGSHPETVFERNGQHEEGGRGISRERPRFSAWTGFHRPLKTFGSSFASSQKAYQERFRERLQTLLEGTELDPSRFQQEVAFWVERTDITEEMVRAESHLKQFRTLFGSQDPVGRKMDFLLQEIHREANTISSKANDAEISQKVVEIKSELEKIQGTGPEY